MGLIKDTHTGTNATFLSIGVRQDDKGRKHAIFGRKCKVDDPDAKQVFKADGQPALTKDGNPVYRQEFAALEGLITKLGRREADYGDGKKQQLLDITVVSDGELFMISLDRGGEYWADFLMRLRNLSLVKSVVLRPYHIEEEGEGYNRGIGMRQDEQKIERVWTKENNWEGGPPRATWDEDEQKYLWGARNRWLEENVLLPIAKQLDDLYASTSVALTTPQQAAAEMHGERRLPGTSGTPAFEEDPSDLPF